MPVSFGVSVDCDVGVCFQVGVGFTVAAMVIVMVPGRVVFMMGWRSGFGFCILFFFVLLLQPSSLLVTGEEKKMTSFSPC